MTLNSFHSRQSTIPKCNFIGVDALPNLNVSRLTCIISINNFNNLEMDSLFNISEIIKPISKHLYFMLVLLPEYCTSFYK